jgi:hypothetical protein
MALPFHVFVSQTERADEQASRPVPVSLSGPDGKTEDEGRGSIIGGCMLAPWYLTQCNR